MFVKVFFLGRPGSGKSTAARFMVELARRRNYPALYIKDYDILYQMFQEDHACKQFRPADYGGFDVLDKTMFDTALKHLEKNVLALPCSEKVQLLAIEFARDDYHTAFKLFSHGFLRDAYIFFVDADLTSCIKRIHKRVETPSEPDHHFVSDHIMQTYYNTDNWMYVSTSLKKEYPFFKEVVSIKNTESVSNLLASVNKFSDVVFQGEFSPSQQQVEQEELNANPPVVISEEPSSGQSAQSADIKNAVTLLPSSSTAYTQYTDEPRSGHVALVR